MPGPLPTSPPIRKSRHTVPDDQAAAAWLAQGVADAGWPVTDVLGRLHLRGTTTRIRHAIALFRGRDTTVESRRSAIVTLAGILEERRALLKEQIGKPDEGALFEIANRYDLRHHKADQRGDYDEAFLDWVFCSYLATVELTNRLIASRTAS